MEKRLPLLPSVCLFMRGAQNKVCKRTSLNRAIHIQLVEPLLRRGEWVSESNQETDGISSNQFFLFNPNSRSKIHWGLYIVHLTCMDCPNILHLNVGTVLMLWMLIVGNASVPTLRTVKGPKETYTKIEKS